MERHLSKKPFDLEYIPGDYTPYKERHPSHRFLLEDKYRRDYNLGEPDLTLSRLYLGDAMANKRNESPPPLRVPPCLIRPGVDLAEMKPHSPKTMAPFNLMPQTAALVDYCISPKVPNKNDKINSSIIPEQRRRRLLDGEIIDINRKLSKNSDEYIDDNGNPINLQAFANFELARKMHQNNLDHQPLPDCITDATYRKLEMSKKFPGLALDVEPIATGVGIKKYKAGPHHCTKMKVYRPKTANVEKHCSTGNDENIVDVKKLNPMDLAICWDYVPAKEPEPPKHIDGSSESGGPAVFTCVQNSPTKQSESAKSTSNPVFNNTSGEVGFFEKDVLRKKFDFAGKPIESISNKHNHDNLCSISTHLNPHLNLNHSQDANHLNRKFHFNYDCNDHSNLEYPAKRIAKQYQSSPDIFREEEFKNLRRKYMGEECDISQTAHCRPPCRRNIVAPNRTITGNNSLLRRTRARFCSKVAPEPNTNCCISDNQESYHHCPRLQRTNNDFLHHHMHSHAATNAALQPRAFRVGRPHYSAGGTLISRQENRKCIGGCSCSLGAQKVVVIPRPRHPYTKRNYNIDTLVPPFKSNAGGAKEGGYPEHWRLASVYQHAYKPVAQRKYPLLQTVYK